MEAFIYLMIFILGSFFGSFFTLAVYRLPRKEDIFIKHSYCPNCQHKLGFFDLFPLLSYLFLRGKCRYCKTKIRPRYFILELFSGLTFTFIAASLQIGKYYLSLDHLIYLAMSFLYVSILFIIAGIDKEHIKIQLNALTVGMVFEFIYIIYLCTVGKANVYEYVIYLVIVIILLLMRIINLNLSLKENYTIQILFLSLYMIIFTGGQLYAISVILTLLSVGIYHIKNRQKEKLAIGFYLSVFNILAYLITNVIYNYVR